MPWSREQVRAFVGGVSESTLRRIETQTEPVPRVPVPGRGADPFDLYDEDEVRAWWARRVAAARHARGTASEPTAPAPAPRPARTRASTRALRLPFTLDAAERSA